MIFHFWKVLVQNALATFPEKKYIFFGWKAHFAGIAIDRWSEIESGSLGEPVCIRLSWSANLVWSAISWFDLEHTIKRKSSSIRTLDGFEEEN